MRAGFKGSILAAGKIPDGDGGQHRGQTSDEADVAELFHRNTILRWLENKAIRLVWNGLVWNVYLIRRSPLESREWNRPRDRSAPRSRRCPHRLRGYQCRYGSSIGIGADITKRESIAATLQEVVLHSFYFR